MTVQRGHAVANGLPVVAVNRVGKEKDPTGRTDGILFWGSSFVAGPQGELCEVLPRERESIRVVNIDLARSELIRRQWLFFRDRRIDAYQGIEERFLD
jgi:N-carbamoylputrescine amidase